jgi:GntR family transcriptional regulator, transcriptional repressor for pyruvate dehydrogenase complex
VVRTLTTTRLRERLAAELARDIVSGELAPGSPIPSEPELVEEYEVSKTVARETVQMLGAVGLVNVQHGKRTTVQDGHEWNILSPLVQRAFLDAGSVDALVRELHEVRQLLEPRAAAHAAARAGDDDCQRLERITRAACERRSTADTAQLLEFDREFHLAVVRSGAHNRVLSAILRDVYTIFHKGIVELSEDSWQTAMEQHEAIAGAISAHDPDAAERMMRDHLEWAAKARGIRRAGDPKAP